MIKKTCFKNRQTHHHPRIITTAYSRRNQATTRFPCRKMSMHFFILIHFKMYHMAVLLILGGECLQKKNVYIQLGAHTSSQAKTSPQTHKYASGITKPHSKIKVTNAKTNKWTLRFLFTIFLLTSPVDIFTRPLNECKCHIISNKIG